jgi:hypothetical protein
MRPTSVLIRNKQAHLGLLFLPFITEQDNCDHSSDAGPTALGTLPARRA